VGEESALNETLGVCYDVAALKGVLDREELARRPAGLWRYHELLPVADPAFRIDLGAGGTRLAPLTQLAEASDGLRLFMKVEGSNPSGSFKDRPIGVAASLALSQGARGLACLTSGNIGSAMAAVAAKAGVPAVVLLLGAAGLAGQGTAVNVEKYVQISAYGARVVTPLGDLAQLYAVADRIETELGWSFLHNLQAYQSDGDKTTAFEICEQLGWRAPTAVFVPTGTGTNLFGLWQGFVLFRELGFIDRLPRLFAVQPQGAASLVAAWEASQAIPALLAQVEPNAAPPISHRVSGYHAYRAIQESGGGAVAVSDEEMLMALRDLASHEGIYAETASAAALAGIRRARALGLLSEEETHQAGIVGILTSHGLKNSLALSQHLAPPPRVAGTWEALREWYI
jgi:threonine synthase